jgi:hypothetical protein
MLKLIVILVKGSITPLCVIRERYIKVSPRVLRQMEGIGR